MMRRVPLGRRNFFQDRRRVALTSAGVAVALLLVLVLQGIFAGSMHQVTRYIERLDADVIMSQRGVTTMHMSSSAVPEADLARVRAIPGTGEVGAIRYTTGVISISSTDRLLSYIIGFDTATNQGGPRLATGRLPGHGEVVIDRLAADQLHVRIGDTIHVFGFSAPISGFSTGGTSIVNTTAFVPFADMAALQPNSVSYILVRAASGVSASALRDRIAAAMPDVTVQTRSEFATSEGRIVRDMSADIMRIMTIVAMGIALAVIGLALFALTIQKLREYGVYKALGATPPRLAGTILVQAAWTVGCALALAFVLAHAIALGVPHLQATVEIDIVGTDVARVAVLAAIVAGVGALIPLRRVLTLDPASAFRR
jgi:putative ABC transport system permease protein